MSRPKLTAAIIGGGPAGLMAAETLAKAGFDVTIYERKAALARKFLMAGRGGLNLTHSEDFSTFMTRYGTAAEKLRPAITHFTPDDLRAWCEGLGQPTFTGTSGRVFPKSLKASPVLRAWQIRLAELQVTFAFKRNWMGWDDQDHLLFTREDGTTETAAPDVTILALGGASWPRLGADGSWTDALQKKSVTITPFAPSNCGFTVAWSDVFSTRHAGAPVKPLALSLNGTTVRGEAMITTKGIEGGAVYALSSALRRVIDTDGHAMLMFDLKPDMNVNALATALNKPRGTLSFSNFLRRQTGLSPVAIALLRETYSGDITRMPAAQLAAHIKAAPLRLDGTFGLDRAISSAGGIALDDVDDTFMIKKLPTVYAIGEMLDWEAPTGGYLLQACFSTAVFAARAIQTRFAAQ